MQGEKIISEDAKNDKFGVPGLVSSIYSLLIDSGK